MQNIKVPRTFQMNTFTRMLHLLFISAVLAAGLGAAPLQPTRAEAVLPADTASPAGLASPEGLLNPDGSLDLSSGFQGALDLSGWQVTLDSQLGPLLAPAAAQSDANWEPSWQALSSQGLNGNVSALAVIGDCVYAGGSFTATGDGSVSNLNHIAQYCNGAWYGLPNQGLNGNVNALLQVGNDLYVGGSFSQTSDGALTDLGNIARYSASIGAWYALPRQGLNGGVWALARHGETVYVGGSFSATGDGWATSLGNIALYNTYFDSWNALPNQGLNNVVYDLAVSDVGVFAGGQFTATGDGTLTNLGYIALYVFNGDFWAPLPNNGLNSWVFALATAGNDVYAGGVFAATGDNSVTALYIARFNLIDSSWYALPNLGLNNYISTLAVSGSDLYVGGSFGQTADGAISGLNHIARYDLEDREWGQLPNQGLNGGVGALAVGVNDLYVGGQFTTLSDGSLTNLGQIARTITTPAAWTALPEQGLNNEVYALAVLGSDLYVGGSFSASGDGALSGLGHIARYNTVTRAWYPLANQGLDAEVDALATVGNDLYVGGYFTATDDGALTNLGRIARYDTLAETWHKLPKNGLNGAVLAFARMDNNLYVGGGFTQSGDGTLTGLGRIARYDTLAGTWNALANAGLDGWVSALATDGSGLLVGGQFSATGDGSLTGLGNFAAYDTSTNTWYATLNQGFNGSVNALASASGAIFVGGGFTQTSDGAVTGLNNIARIDLVSGATSALPRAGLFAGNVNALAVAGDDLYVGGVFDQAYDGTLTDMGNIALYNIRSGAWRKLSRQGLDDWVYALAVGSGGVYVGGGFTALNDGAPTDMNYIAHYGIDAWQPLPHQGFYGGIEALAVSGSDVYVAGNFARSGDSALTNMGNIARYDTIYHEWGALPHQGLNGSVRALAVYGNNLYVGGGFTQTGDGALNLDYIARFDLAAGTWYALPKQGLNDYVLALLVVDGDLYVGGDFTATGDGTLTNLGCIARYDISGNTWHALANQGVDDYVYALAAKGNHLYVGGQFTALSDGSLTNLGQIARYNLSTAAWSALPRQGLNSYVYALAFDGDDLYVGGAFDETGDGVLTDLGSIARYDTAGGAWYALNNQGLSGNYNEVKALAVMGCNLYVGGDFYETGDNLVNDLNGIARYDTAACAWHPLPNQGLDDQVYALAFLGDDLYVGGHYRMTDDKTLLELGGIARIEIGYPHQIYLPVVMK
ncbi:MAG: hypothetical protein JXA78_18865 [Anaerolineales bacterium]|nr:hypothetical protein [Anaerolineales bacterium]